jgi:ABC-type amino acid transport substrate-binding protein
MALRKGEPSTKAAINEWIAARKADGFLAERFHYWFEQRSWLSSVQS